MKAKNPFETLLKEHLEKFAKGDSVFAEKLKATKKTLSGCVVYIFKEAKKLAINCNEVGGSVAPISDETVYGWAVHYFEEDAITEPSVQEKQSFEKSMQIDPTFGGMSLATFSTTL